jgi:hypothetical protein
LPGAALRFAPSALHGTLGGATMTTPGGAGTTPRTVFNNSFVLGSSASLIGSELPGLLGSGPLSWIETFVTFCGMVGLQAMDLGRLGSKPSPHPRACALSCPSPFAGRGFSGSGLILFLAAPNFVWSPPSHLARPSLCPSHNGGAWSRRSPFPSVLVWKHTSSVKKSPIWARRKSPIWGRCSGPPR